MAAGTGAEVGLGIMGRSRRWVGDARQGGWQQWLGGCKGAKGWLGVLQPKDTQLPQRVEQWLWCWTRPGQHLGFK